MAFIVDNVTNIDKHPQYDCYLFAHIMWYLLNDLDDIFTKMQKHLKGKYFINIMPFYKGSQKYGRDKFTNVDEFLKRVPFENMVNVHVDVASDKISYSSVTAFKI